jgi:hypothetical protein
VRLDEILITAMDNPSPDSGSSSGSSGSKRKYNCLCDYCISLHPAGRNVSYSTRQRHKDKQLKIDAERGNPIYQAYEHHSDAHNNNNNHGYESNENMYSNINADSDDDKENNDNINVANESDSDIRGGNSNVITSSNWGKFQIAVTPFNYALLTFCVQHI